MPFPPPPKETSHLVPHLLRFLSPKLGLPHRNTAADTYSAVFPDSSLVSAAVSENWSASCFFLCFCWLPVPRLSLYRADRDSFCGLPVCASMSMTFAGIFPRIDTLSGRDRAFTSSVFPIFFFFLLESPFFSRVFVCFCRVWCYTMVFASGFALCRHGNDTLGAYWALWCVVPNVTQGPGWALFILYSQRVWSW